MATFTTTYVGILFLGCFVCGSQVSRNLQDVDNCLGVDPTACFFEQAMRAVVNAAAADLLPLTNSTESSRSEADIEEKLSQKLEEIIEAELQSHESPRKTGDSMIRTFNRAWKYLIPLMIGVILKLATFTPMVLMVLTLIAKSAFMSGNMALFLTGLNIALKYWYPKWSSAAQTSHSDHSYQGYDQPYDPYGHNANGFNYGYQGQGTGQLDLRSQNKIPAGEYSRIS